MTETTDPPPIARASGPPVPAVLLVGLALFALALAHFTAAIGTTAFHRDEARWIFHATALRDLTDPLGPAWEESLRNLDQPPMTGYLLGLGLMAQGRELGTTGWWSMDQNDDWNFANGNWPSQGDLVAGRRFNALLGACTVVVIFLIVTRLTNVVGGAAAALFLIAHPLMTYLSSLIDSDITLALLLALAALTALWLAETPSWPRAVIPGMLLGLGGATKLTPLAVSVAFAGLAVILLLQGRLSRREPRAREQRLGLMLLVQPLIAVLTFVAVSPYLWRDPIGHSRNLLAFRAHEIDNQRQFWPHLQVDGLFGALARVWELLGVQASTVGWLAARAPSLSHDLWRFHGLDLMLGGAGIALLLIIAWRGGPACPAALALAVLGTSAVITIVAMRVYFPRYLLPVTLLLAVGAGVLIGSAWAALPQRATGHRRGSTAVSHDLNLAPAGDAAAGT